MGSSDIETIKDAGLDKFLSRVKGAGKIANPFTKYTEATNISGGTLGNNAIFNVGSKQVKIDGPKSRITVNDGVNDRILFGKREDGTFGIDVSSAGFDVHSAYEGEMDLTSKATDDWTEFDPSAFTYLSSTTLTVSTKYTTSSDFAIGDKVRLIQGGDTKYFYVYNNQEAEILSLRAGSSFTLENEAITSIYFSSKSNPGGHPIYFSFASTLNVFDQAHTVSDDGTFVGYFFMIGSTIFASYNRTGYTLGGSADYYLHEDLPVARDNSYPIFFTGIGGDSVAAGSYYYSIAVKSPPGAGSANSYTNIELHRLPYAVYALSSSSHHEFNIFYKVP